MAQRQHKPFIFSDGSTIEVWQASWDMSMERHEIGEQARTEKAKEDSQVDPALLDFQEHIYSALASCSTGDLPSMAQVYQLQPADLDGWFLVSREMNPNWYDLGELVDQDLHLSDGSCITVHSRRPSVLRRRFQLDREAEKGVPLDNIRKEIFRVTYYPKLAGCSTGDVPSMEEARAQWSEDDLQAWYNAAVAVIPEWFLALEQIVERNQALAEQAQKKKGGHTRSRPVHETALPAKQ